MSLDNDNIICFGKNCYNIYQEPIYIYTFNYLYYIFNTVIPLIILNLILLFICFITITYVYYIIQMYVMVNYYRGNNKCNYCCKEKKDNEFIYICPEKYYIKQTDEDFKKFSFKSQRNTLPICYCKDNINCEINIKTFIANIIPYRQNIKFEYLDFKIENEYLYLSEIIYLLNFVLINNILFDNYLQNHEDVYSYINTFSTSDKCQYEIISILGCWDGWKNIKKNEYDDDTFYKLLPPKYKGYNITYGNFSSKKKNNNNNGSKYIQYSNKNTFVRWTYDKIKHKWIEYKKTNEHSKKMYGYMNTGRTSNTIPLCPL